jgi:hypothetical protein
VTSFLNIDSEENSGSTKHLLSSGIRPHWQTYSSSSITGSSAITCSVEFSDYSPGPPARMNILLFILLYQTWVLSEFPSIILTTDGNIPVYYLHFGVIHCKYFIFINAIMDLSEPVAFSVALRNYWQLLYYFYWCIQLDCINIQYQCNLSIQLYTFLSIIHQYLLCHSFRYLCSLILHCGWIFKTDLWTWNYDHPEGIQDDADIPFLFMDPSLYYW